MATTTWVYEKYLTRPLLKVLTRPLLKASQNSPDLHQGLTELGPTFFVLSITPKRIDRRVLEHEYLDINSYLFL